MRHTYWPSVAIRGLEEQKVGFEPLVDLVFGCLFARCLHDGSTNKRSKRERRLLRVRLPKRSPFIKVFKQN
jgi:hypothetical protein